MRIRLAVRAEIKSSKCSKRCRRYWQHGDALGMHGCAIRFPVAKYLLVQRHRKVHMVDQLVFDLEWS